MEEEIFALAKALGQVDQEREEALRTLCSAACAQLQTLLKPGVTPGDCRELFQLAAAWTALADLSEGGQSAGLASFSAGDLSMQFSGGGEQAAALRLRAREALRPYCADQGFAFRGVRG